MNVREDFLTAQVSSDLGESLEGHGDVDILRASGAVARQYSTALAVFRLTEQGDKHSMRAAFDGLLAECVKLKIDDQPIHTVSHVLQWMLQRTCPDCHGRKKRLLPMTHKLSGEDCPTCHGTGERPKLAWGNDEHALHERVLQQMGAAAAALKRKLA
jgi:hypothetical protein